MVLSKPPNMHVTKAFDLSGKVAAVTGKQNELGRVVDSTVTKHSGGTRGIGLEVCRGLAEAGADVKYICLILLSELLTVPRSP